MMITNPENHPAYPITIRKINEDGTIHEEIYPGMTVRAAMAMHFAAAVVGSEAGIVNTPMATVAAEAVALADALIRELQK